MLITFLPPIKCSFSSEDAQRYDMMPLNDLADVSNISNIMGIEINMKALSSVYDRSIINPTDDNKQAVNIVFYSGLKLWLSEKDPKIQKDAEKYHVDI